MSIEELKSIFIPFSLQLHLNPHVQCYFARIKFLLSLADISKHFFNQPLCFGFQVQKDLGQVVWELFGQSAKHTVFRLTC